MVGEALLKPSQIGALEWSLGASADLVFAADRSGRVVFVNGAARKRWPESIETMDAAALFGPITRETYRDAAAQVFAGKSAVTFEWGDYQHGNVRTWFSTTISALRDGAVVAGVLCVARDALELKRSEARLRRSEQLMVDTQGVAHLGTWEWDPTQPTATWSDELYKIYGHTRTSYTPSYEGYLQMVHPDDRDRVAEATNQVFQHHVPYSHDERIFRPDGSMRYLHTWAHPMFDETGTLVRLVGVCQDITDLKLAEEELRRLNAELEWRVADRTRTIEASMQDLEAFNSMVSHDLRAPLSVIQLSTSIIAREPTPARLDENIVRIQRSVAHMSRLVDDLLTLARVGHSKLERVDVDISALCVDVIEDLRHGAPERSVEVMVEPDLRLHADAGFMRAALTNLLDNAWKYSSRVDAARIEVGHTGSAIFVRDNGAGFDMAEGHRLFAPFERLQTAVDFVGTGVGLATVHRIVERHGGRIWAESAPGQGATFFLELP